jgi:flagellar basal body-associated protein FliL
MTTERKEATVKKKILIIVPVLLLLLAGGGAYKFLFAPQEEEPKPKVEGTVYVLGKEFLVNLADQRFAKVTVALVLDPHDTSTEPAEAGAHGPPPPPPDGFGPMPQEALVRDIITDQLTGASDADLINPAQRGKVKLRLLKAIKKSTDVHAEDVLFTDVTVQ